MTHRAQGAGGEAGRILLVEDDVHARRIGADALRSAGFEVHEARDGLEAVASAASLHPRLVVMDMALPGLAGTEATVRIKRDVRPAPIVLFLTARAMPSDLDAARRAGADGFLTKPIDPFDLVEEVRRRLGAPARPDAEGAGGAGRTGAER